MLEEILNIELDEVDAEIFEEIPQELSGCAGCGINKGRGSCG
jgi:hypothetical protein